MRSVEEKLPWFLRKTPEEADPDCLLCRLGSCGQGALTGSVGAGCWSGACWSKLCPSSCPDVEVEQSRSRSGSCQGVLELHVLNTEQRMLLVNGAFPQNFSLTMCRPKGRACTGRRADLKQAKPLMQSLSFGKGAPLRLCPWRRLAVRYKYIVKLHRVPGLGHGAAEESVVVKQRRARCSAAREQKWGTQMGNTALLPGSCDESTYREMIWSAHNSDHHTCPQKNFTYVMKEAFTNLQSPEGENYCMSNNKHLNSTWQLDWYKH